MAIVGISGSPFPGGNTDRLVQAVLEQTGREHLFVNLTSLDFVPCRGCAELCAKTNICPLEDGLRPYFEPILEADALVLGSPIHSDMVTAWMYSFISRIWCFRHIRRRLQDKPLLFVVTGRTAATEGPALRHFDETVRRIQAREFAIKTPPEPGICKECDLRALCHTDGIITKEARG